ncbi:MAG: M15 family metallopeptidase [Cellvibrionaceae bacterium]
MQDLKVLTGQTESHLVEVAELGCRLHAQVVGPFKQLRAAARIAGFDLAVASSFRDFSRQQAIWDDKLAGRRPVLDDHGVPVALERLDDWGKVQAVMRWSALPGASRHHWGTDLDIFDRNGLGPDHPHVELTAAEWQPGGPFYEFHGWLGEAMARGQACGFVRPYSVDRGGIACEPWHISYEPVAADFQRTLSAAVLREVISQADIALRDTVLSHLDEIHRRFISVS